MDMRHILNKCRALALVALASLGLMTVTASAVPINIFNTGVAGLGVVDLNYSLDTGTAIGIVRHPNWVAAPVGSEWIGLSDADVNSHPVGFHNFTTTFDLTGFNPNSASISGSYAVDNEIEIILNGTTILGPGSGSFGSLQAFAISSSFVAGPNTLVFRVLNLSGTSGNPMGLLVTGLTSDVSAVPLPAALPLYGTGLAIMGFIGWRRKRKVATA